jgi:hypothetical protein
METVGHLLFLLLPHTRTHQELQLEEEKKEKKTSKISFTFNKFINYESIYYNFYYQHDDVLVQPSLLEMTTHLYLDQEMLHLTGSFFSRGAPPITRTSFLLGDRGYVRGVYKSIERVNC